MSSSVLRTVVDRGRYIVHVGFGQSAASSASGLWGSTEEWWGAAARRGRASRVCVSRPLDSAKRRFCPQGRRFLHPEYILLCLTERLRESLVWEQPPLFRLAL